MINDELLQIAAGEVDACIMDHLSAQPEHLFSKRFRRKMNHLIQKTDYPVKHLLTTCAAILVAVLTLFATLMTISPTVRAAVQAWLKEVSIDGISYVFQDWPKQRNPGFTLHQVPEGYELMKGSETDRGGRYRYCNDDGDKLYFDYICGVDAAALYLETKDSVWQSVMVGNEPADIYVYNDERDPSCIVWTDSATGALFWIFYEGEPEELIHLAESVAISEKN